MEISELESLVTNYQQGQPDVMQGFEPALQAERKSLAEAFLNASDKDIRGEYEGPQGKRFHLLRRVGLQDLPRNAEANRLTNQILQKWDRNKSTNTLIAAMLMLQPRELPLPGHFAEITEWLRQDYANYLLTPPGVFSRIGEADQFAVFFAAMVDMFHRSLMSDDTFAGADEIRNFFVQRANFIQFYFNERNLRHTYRQRAEIMESWALTQNAPLSFMFPLRTGKRNSESKIKVGILSAHFSPQTEIYLMLSYFDKLPREQCHLTLYSLRQTEHPLEKHCRSRADNFVLLSEEAYPQKAARIRADELDVLLIGTNTSAVTNPIAIMALFRMARIHLIVENSPVSTGFTQTDYYLSSFFNEPDENAGESYTESLYRVPGMLNYYAYYMDKDPRTVTISRSDLNIPEDAVIFFSGANFFKILPELSNVWSWIFSQVQNSYLILLPFNPNWTKQYLAIPFINRIRTQMEEAGVDFANRVRILQRVPTRADVHGIMELCDIYLDSFPYAGACSLIDPLLVGLPIVCRAGATMRGNLAAAMLRGAGLDDLIVSDAGEYVERAVALSRNSELRERIRCRIRESLSAYNPFFDTGSCGIKIGAAFTDMVDRQRRAEMRLLRQEPDHLKERITSLSDGLSRTRNPFFRNLTGLELFRLLIIPYFRSLPEDKGTPRMMDIGAESGQFAIPFLNMGWYADLFEPNPGYQAQLNSLAQQASGRLRVFPGSETEILKFQQENLQVDMIRIGSVEESLSNRMLNQNGSDSLNSKLILLTSEAKHPVFDFHKQGYQQIVFGYGRDGKSGARDQKYYLAGLDFGNTAYEKTDVLFFHQEDTVFLVTLIRLLESFLPACERDKAVW